MEEVKPEVMEEPTGERWDPLGAPNDQSEEISFDKTEFIYNDHSMEKLRTLEEEQELLNSSLFALTTHFAQVQFRIRQIVNSPVETREGLLKSLEDFAFRGIPDISLVKDRMDEASLAEAIHLRRNQQNELINRLKSQLRELEQYAFENGEAGLPQDVVLERQRAILNEIKSRMNLEIDEQNFYQMSTIDIKTQINLALDQITSPLKIKEHLVTQLKTQIADLERFINYLQSDNKHEKCSCGCSFHSIKKSKTDTIGLIQRTASLLQMFALLQLGCGIQHFKRNDLKNTMKINHYGDLRAKLELAVLHVKELAQKTENNETNVQLVTAVRKYLATSIRDLLQHGTSTTINNSSIVPFIGCFPKRQINDTQLHCWEIILEYYSLKNGEKFNSTPARKLSQSFNLDIAGAIPNSNKHNMLCTIGSIISSHSPYKRSYDSHFKAFICAALNANKLVCWLNLILSCNQIIKLHYFPWSYVAKTGFQDSLRSLDMLTCYNFDLPVDLAVRQFQNIKDVFT